MTEAPVLATSSGVFGFGLSAPGLFSPGLLSPGVGVTVFALTVIVKESVSLPEVTVTVTSPAAVNGLVRSTVLPSASTADSLYSPSFSSAVLPSDQVPVTARPVLANVSSTVYVVLSGLDVTLMDLSVAGSGSGSLAVTVTSKVAVLPLAVTVTVTFPALANALSSATAAPSCVAESVYSPAVRVFVLPSDIVAVTASPVASNVSPTL